jgi:hypothetical protein
MIGSWIYLGNAGGWEELMIKQMEVVFSPCFLIAHVAW